jgi:hypothetical protein
VAKRGARPPINTTIREHPMASYWDLLPAGAWPTQPFIPPYDPMQARWAVDTTQASPSPTDWRLARGPIFSNPANPAGYDLAPPASPGLRALGAPSYPDFSVPFAPNPDPGIDDPARSQRMADDAKRTYDAAMWAFGPPSAPQAPPIRDAAPGPYRAPVQNVADTVGTAAATGANGRTITGINLASPSPAPATVDAPRPRIPMSGVDDVDHPPAPIRATTTSPPPANWRDKWTAAAHEFSESVRYYSGPEISKILNDLSGAFMAVAPGAGTTRAWQDKANVGRDLQAGHYGQAAIDYGRGLLNVGTDLLPFLRPGRVGGAAGATARGDRAAVAADRPPVSEVTNPREVRQSPTAPAETVPPRPVEALRDLVTAADHAASPHGQVSAAPSAEPAPTSVLDNANFAQNWYEEKFSDRGPLRGRYIDELVNELNSDVLKPSDLDVHYIVRDGHTLIQNTRTSQTLERAGIPRWKWNAVNMTGDPDAERDVSSQLERNGLTSEGVPNVARKADWEAAGNPLFPPRPPKPRKPR